MIWNDILFDREVTDSNLHACLSRIFSISEEKLAIVKNIEQVSTVGQKDIICIHFKVDGEYNTLLNIFINNDKLVPNNDIECVKKLASYFKCKCLLPDESLDSCSMYEVDHEGNVFLVLLDSEKDDEVSYNVAKRKKLVPSKDINNEGLE